MNAFEEIHHRLSSMDRKVTRVYYAWLIGASIVLLASIVNAVFPDQALKTKTDACTAFGGQLAQVVVRQKEFVCISRVQLAPELPPLPGAKP